MRMYKTGSRGRRRHAEPDTLVQFILTRLWNIEDTEESLAADQLLLC